MFICSCQIIYKSAYIQYEHLLKQTGPRTNPGDVDDDESQSLSPASELCARASILFDEKRDLDEAESLFVKVIYMYLCIHEYMYVELEHAKNGNAFA
jgi:hypothetical protein